MSQATLRELDEAIQQALDQPPSGPAVRINPVPPSQPASPSLEFDDEASVENLDDAILTQLTGAILPRGRTIEVTIHIYLTSLSYLSQDGSPATFSALMGATVKEDSDAPTFSALIAGPGDRRPLRPDLVGKLRQGPRPEPRLQRRSGARAGPPGSEPLTLMRDEDLRSPLSARAEARIDGVAYGLDYVGNFKHHTGTLGPFGFYANFYDER